MFIALSELYCQQQKPIQVEGTLRVAHYTMEPIWKLRAFNIDFGELNHHLMTKYGKYLCKWYVNGRKQSTEVKYMSKHAAKQHEMYLHILGVM